MINLTPDELDLLARIKEKEELRPFFFRKAKGLKWFECLDHEGYFSPTEIPKPVRSKNEGYVEVPFWSAVEYLVATSPELVEPHNHIFAGRFLNIIRSATQYAIEKKFSNYRTWWQFSKVIQYIPKELITLDDISLFKYWLDDPYDKSLVCESLVERWLLDLFAQNDAHCNTLAITFLQVLFEVRFEDRQYGNSSRKEAVLRLDRRQAKEVITHLATKAGQVLGLNAVKLFQNSLEHILKELNKDGWSYLWRAAIENHEQNHEGDDAEDILIEGLRDSLMAFITHSPMDANSYILKLLSSAYQTIKRIAVYAISNNYKTLGGLVKALLREEFFRNNFRHEMWHLLQNNYPQFSKANKKKVLAIIGNIIEVDDKGERREGATIYKKAIWLRAIHTFGKSESKLYLSCIEKVGGEPEHPDFSSYMSSGWLADDSPIPQDELLSMEVDKLVETLALHTNPNQHKKPGIEGMASALRQIIKASPIKYYGNLNLFLDLGPVYMHQLLEAYAELWAEKALLPWEEIWHSILSNCRELITREFFWKHGSKEDVSEFGANKSWVISSIASLIKNGTRSDEHAFPEKLLPLAKEILVILLNQTKGEQFEQNSDAVFISINSPRGKILEAFINLSLRYCRLSDKKGEGHIQVWEELAPIFNDELERSNLNEFEFVTLAVNYLPNFLYMSKEWLLANLSKIFDQKNYLKWLCAMKGYVYVNSVYREIYDYLKEHGDFILALDDENLRNNVTDKIVQNIVIAFLYDYEPLDDKQSILNRILERGRSNELSQLIWFIWTFRNQKNTQIKLRIFELWPYVLAAIDTSKHEGRKLASKLSTWAVFIDEINDSNRPLLLAGAGHAEEDYNSHDLLEMIARVSKKQPKEAAGIWGNLLNNSGSDFPEEAVQKSLKNLCENGNEGKRYATYIVSKFLAKGNDRPFHWLKQILD